MTVSVNGEARELPAGATVATLVREVSGGTIDGRGIAVALAGEVVPRSGWESCPLSEGDVVEVLVAVQGG